MCQTNRNRPGMEIKMWKLNEKELRSDFDETPTRTVDLETYVRIGIGRKTVAERNSTGDN